MKRTGPLGFEKQKCPYQTCGKMVEILKQTRFGQKGGMWIAVPCMHYGPLVETDDKEKP